MLLDSDLALLYEVTTGRLVEAVKRNSERFPSDFMFQLTAEEFDDLRSQFAIASEKQPGNPSAGSGWGGRRTPPYVFTEQGVAMLSGVLRSKRAVTVNIAIMRAFVQLRQLAATHSELSKRLDDLERAYGDHDLKLQSIFEALRQMMNPPDSPRRPIGF